MMWFSALFSPLQRAELLHTNNEEKFFLRARVLVAVFAFAPCDVSNNSYKNNRSDGIVLVLKLV